MRLEIVGNLKRDTKNIIKSLIFPCKIIQKYMAKQLYKRKKLNGDKLYICFHNNNKVEQIFKLLSMIEISIQEHRMFQFWLDKNIFFVNRYDRNDALPPDYSMIINSSIDELIRENQKKKGNIAQQNINLLQEILKYVEKIITEIDVRLEKEPKYNKELIRSKYYFERMKEYPAETLEEGLQRILFWSSLFWQTGHTLVGLGRLDKILDGLMLPETKEETEYLIMEFYQELHKYYEYKSNSILGDTGQLIILGGTENDGSYFCNDLTYAFIKAMIKFQKPDPKLLLRVSSNMPQDLLELGLECIATGIGGPLLANDEVIIPALKEFGYIHEDACNYVTSACWETLSYGKSWGRGNLADINLAKILVDTYKSNKFEECNSFEDVMSLYTSFLQEEITSCLKRLNYIKWEPNPLMTLFTENCVEVDKDVSEGGAKYHDYGILSVGLANAVDSLMNIREFVFSDRAMFSLKELKEAGLNDYVERRDIERKLSEKSYYGRDDKAVIEIVSYITNAIAESCEKYRNPYGGKVKFGISSPSYVTQGKMCGATLDGRKAGMPLSVHISGKSGLAYTELINFAGALNYSGVRANAGVVDFFVSPDFIKNNFKKFVLFMKSAIEVGFFELQLNVVSSKTLIAAKKNPELFPELIVRVWGFSAYFKDLPTEYQEVLIQRAMDSEKGGYYGNENFG